MTTQADRFTVYSEDPWVPRDKIDPARTWTLHVPVPGQAAAAAAVQTLQQAGAEALLGTWAGGDSWWQWCEPAEDPDEVALHVEFTASREARLHTGQALAALVVADTDPVYVTTAHDWSIDCTSIVP